MRTAKKRLLGDAIWNSPARCDLLKTDQAANNNGQMCSRGACFFYWCYSNSAGQKIWVSDRTVFVVEEDQTDNPGRAGRDA
ncbi:hypothetical protein Bxe_B0514 [Paraburkholderia xenovorans LB400]|uniref:Uncharacterized protein n=1 Tax=Paraburkholderia xenovorans (strain LB400) TaxID=266265 RepID=Q13KF6_PARXL|nr:hypothetical protein Bxe_B0514 [Paraburkholderia xenovorans LB400]